ncbi:hypothetical protein D3C81_1294710 [compost metagenome]
MNLVVVSDQFAKGCDQVRQGVRFVGSAGVEQGVHGIDGGGVLTFCPDRMQRHDFGQSPEVIGQRSNVQAGFHLSYSL